MWKTFFVNGYRVVAKVYDLPSVHGINGLGRISKMEIRDGADNIVANYDRGWDFNDLGVGIHDIITHLASLIGG